MTSEWKMHESSMDSANMLFETLPPFLPHMQSDETLFSWCARYHRLSGNSVGMCSSQQLFGSALAGLKHDLPSHLENFETITGGLVGTAGDIALKHTLLGYYAPFLETVALQRALSLMSGSATSTLKSFLGLMPSRIDASHPLKACRLCIKEDLASEGISRWRLEHQWPGVWVCRKHRRMLFSVSKDVQPRHLRSWLLPEDIDSENRVMPRQCDVGAHEKLLQIAEVTAALVQRTDEPLEGRILRCAYLLGAERQGWLASDGSLRLKPLSDAFYHYYRGLQHIPGFSITADVRQDSGGFLGLLTRNYPGRRHPIKHAIFVAFLYPTISDFERTYGEVRELIHVGGVNDFLRMLARRQRSELRHLVEDHGHSVSSAAEILSVPVGMAARWAKADGMDYQARPRVLSEEGKAQLRQLLTSGVEYAEIIRQTGFKKSLIRSYLAKDKTLREQWHRCRKDKVRHTKRDRLKFLLQAYPGIPLKSVLRIPGNGYGWLAKNDREWLELSLPVLRQP